MIFGFFIFYFQELKRKLNQKHLNYKKILYEHPNPSNLDVIKETPRNPIKEYNYDLDKFLQESDLEPFDLDKYFLSAFDKNSGLIIRFWIANSPYAIAMQGELYEGTLLSNWFDFDYDHFRKREAIHEWNDVRPSKYEMGRLALLYKSYLKEYEKDPKNKKIFFDFPYYKANGKYFKLTSLDEEQFEEEYAYHLLKKE